MRILIPTPLTNLPLIAELLGRRHEVVGAEGTSEAELIEAVADVDGFVATGMDVSAAVIAAAPRLQVLGTPQVGVDRIDVAAATSAGIPVLSSAGLTAHSVAEFALGLMIAASRRIVEADRDLRGAAGWSSRRTYAEPDLRLGRELRGSTVGIAGLGLIGSELARMAAAAFGCRVLGYDPVVDAEEMTRRGAEKRDSIVDLAREADFLVLHVPLLPQTRHLVDAEVLSAMKPTATVINVSRGGVVDEVALAVALREGTIAGAALDVFENEPLPQDSPLRELGNIILSPHVAGVTHEWNEQRSRAFAERMLQVLDGERPENLVAPDVWPAFLARRAELLR